MAVTLKDLAKALNLSISTVDAALYNRPDISVATRKRVRAMVQEMNYRPNLVARSLVTRKTHVLGVVVPDLSRSFFTEVTKGIDHVASMSGYNILLCNTGEDPAREDEQVRTLVGKQVDGLILASAHPQGSTGLRDELANCGIPCVLVDRFFPDLPFVGGDDVQIGRLATEHLIQQGYRNIAHLRGPNVSTAIGRLEGYLKALSDHGLRPRNDCIVEASYHGESSGFKAMRKLLRVLPAADAVFAASDPIAIGALDAITEAGLRVPEDIGLVGVGNHRYGQYLRVSLTTVDQNRLEIGKQATLLLLELIEGKIDRSPRLTLLKPKLVPRESSLRLRNADSSHPKGIKGSDRPVSRRTAPRRTL